jgi:hypothetical protein
MLGGMFVNAYPPSCFTILDAWACLSMPNPQVAHYLDAWACLSMPIPQVVLYLSKISRPIVKTL